MNKSFSDRAPVRVGSLVKISSYHDVDKKKPRTRPAVIKLYSSLQGLKTTPFMSFDKVLVLCPEDAALVTMVVDVSEYEYANIQLKPMVEAVKIIYDEKVWWMFSCDIEEVLRY